MDLIRIISFIIFFLLFSCKQEIVEEVSLKNIIRNGKVISYNDLNEFQKRNVNNCYFYPYQNWRDIKEYKKEDAYFVIVEIDYFLLAKIQNYDFEYEKSQNRTNPLLQYGKYQNRWQFYDENGLLINSSAKFEGHKIFEFERKNKFDYIIIGPIQTKPSKIEIKIVTDDYKYMDYPFYIF